MLYIVDFYIVTGIIIKNDSVQNTIFFCTFRFGGYTRGKRKTMIGIVAKLQKL